MHIHPQQVVAPRCRTDEGENHIERANDYDGEADKELTWSVRRAIRREPYWVFITPFVTAFAEGRRGMTQGHSRILDLLFSHGRLDFLYEAL